MWIRRRPYQEKWAELGRLDQVTSRTTQPIEAHVRPAHQPPTSSSHLIFSTSRPPEGRRKPRQTNREAKPGHEGRGLREAARMGRKRKELLSSAPWRTGEAAEDEDAARMSREGKVSVTSNPGETPTMSVPRSRRPDLDLTVDDFEEDEIDPELRYSFQRNSRVPYTPTRPSLLFFFFGSQ